MTQREEFEKWLNTLDKQTLVTMAAKQARTIEKLQAATKAAAPEGWKLVPVAPTEEMVDAGKVGYEYAKIADCDPLDCIHDAILEAIAAAPDGDK